MMTKLEEVARAICIADDVDPDETGMGLGQTMPEGTTYPLWQARMKQARAAVEALKTPNDFMAEQGGQVVKLAHWTPRMFWEGVIDAILDEKL